MGYNLYVEIFLRFKFYPRFFFSFCHHFSPLRDSNFSTYKDLRRNSIQHLKENLDVSNSNCRKISLSQGGNFSWSIPKGIHGMGYRDEEATYLRCQEGILHIKMPTWHLKCFLRWAPKPLFSATGLKG